MKLKKSNILIALVLVFSLLQVSPAFAEDGKDVTESIKKVENFEKKVVEKFEEKSSEAAKKQEARKDKQQNNLSSFKDKAVKEIDKRINQLNKLLQRIQNDQKLSSDEKTSLSSDIQADIDELTGIKGKVETDSDKIEVKDDFKKVKDIKVFAISNPKTRLLITIDNLQSVATKLTGFTPKIQDLINNLKSEGKDVAKLQSLLNDINSRLTAINTQLASDKTTVLGVTAGTTNSQSTFEQVRKDLAEVRQSFAQVRHDFGQMRETFRIIIIGGNSGNGSASVSPVPSSSPIPSASPIPTPTSTPTSTP